MTKKQEQESIRLQVIKLHRVGLTPTEIIDKLGCNERYVYRIVAECRKIEQEELLDRIYQTQLFIIELIRKIPGVPKSIIDERLAQIESQSEQGG